MKNPFPNLFSPVKIKDKIIKNRIVSTSHHTKLGKEGLITEDLIAYHERRAQGGVGLIIVEAQCVDRTAVTDETFLQPFRKGWSDGARKLVRRVKSYGARIFFQIWHPGRQSTSSTSLLPLYAPSSIPCFAMREPPKEMEIEEIKILIKNFGETAKRIRDVGADGVEIHCAHGYLLQQFLSPYSNRRDDEYGRDFEGMTRLLREVIERVHDIVGKDMVIGVRLCADEMLGYGITPEYSKKVAQYIEKLKKVDYLSITCGNYTTFFTISPPMNFPVACFAGYGEMIKSSVSLPVIIAGRINSPSVAEEIIREKKADLVAVTRGLICDPDFPKKVMEGKGHLIRKCMACNQGCIGRIRAGLHVSCSQNPEAGRERWFKIKPAKSKKKVVVVGGGIAGMKAAEVLRIRGHEVILIEKEKALGGKINFISKTPKRDSLLESVEYLKAILEELDVDVRLNKFADSKYVLSLNPDYVIVATGSKVSRSVPPPFLELKNPYHPKVLTWEDVYKSDGNIDGEKIVVYSVEPYHKGIYCARFLLEKGKKVTLLDPYENILEYGKGESISSFFLIQEILMMGGEIQNFSAIEEVTDEGCVVMNTMTFSTRIIPCDKLVLLCPDLPDADLYFELKKEGINVQRCGDAIVPRQIDHAIISAFQVANSID
jgi:2,4-dienoyl-CoA reductase-like NADH-dependent reductase (Old Yellow Enzyme family)